MDPLRPTTSIAAPMKIARSFRPFMFPPGLLPSLLYASSRPGESQFEPLEQAENACAPLDQPPEGASGSVSNSRSSFRWLVERSASIFGLFERFELTLAWP